ncbi:MAG: sigma-E factor negative regulatory protein [Gammaproteobacteria bacterium]
MSDTDKEQLSALVDGEIDTDADGLLTRLGRDEKLQASWARYHLISDCIKGQAPVHPAPKLHTRVARRLTAEPVILAPVRKPRLNTLFKPVAGFAIAASVAALAILGIQVPLNDDPRQAIRPLAAHTPLAEQTLPRSAPVPVRQVSSKNGNAAQPRSDSNEMFHRYLVNHNEYRISAGRQGILPYVRLVSDDQR